jgi:hypothetical protein
LSASEKARGSEEGESSTRVEVVSVAAESTRFVVFGYHGLRTIGWQLIKGGDAGEDGGKEVSYCSREEEKSTTRFRPTEEAVGESATSRGLGAAIG